MIPNHFSHKLSALDLEMAGFVPPGGNWKNIPTHVPSKRLEQIRTSYAAGEGSRSTYYGRLRPDQPSYTINTYFNRPGNGCFLHYDFDGGQHRTISQREAARFQSFPDAFKFLGSKLSINKQIGNAVPPLLGYQIATSFSEVGSYIDLFSGAGGLSLGFRWAGWKQIVANDIEASFLDTYKANLGGKIVCGDITQPSVCGEIVSIAKAAPRNGPTILLGGPPCQGFSTAGNKRSMADARNHLFKQYAKILGALNIDGFVFENVPGLLSMEGGETLKEIRATLEACGFQIRVLRLRAEEFGVPQRRTRILVVGERDGTLLAPLKPVTFHNTDRLPLNVGLGVWGAQEALGDLPAISASEDGSGLHYKSEPLNLYQKFVRGHIDAESILQVMQRSVAA